MVNYWNGYQFQLLFPGNLALKRGSNNYWSPVFNIDGILSSIGYKNFGFERVKKNDRTNFMRLLRTKNIVTTSFKYTVEDSVKPMVVYFLDHLAVKELLKFITTVIFFVGKFFVIDFCRKVKQMSFVTLTKSRFLKSTSLKWA